MWPHDIFIVVSKLAKINMLKIFCATNNTTSEIFATTNELTCEIITVQNIRAFAVSMSLP